jgi:transposase
LERRRLRAIALIGDGMPAAEAARRTGAHSISVYRWYHAYRRGGKKALAPKPVPGRPSKLTSAQKARLIKLLAEGPLEHGYTTQLWTTARIAVVIKKAFGIVYHRDHVGRLLHGLGWSCQKPERRFLARKEKKIKAWIKDTWPVLKKTPTGWAPISPS